MAGGSGPGVVRCTLPPIRPQEADPQGTQAVTANWRIEKVRAKIREGGKQREFIWEVTCPYPPDEPTWDNDFGRGMRCGCRRFRTEGKAIRYVERMKGGTE